MTRRRLLRLVGIGVAMAALSLAWPLPESAAPGRTASLRVADRDGGLLREIRPDGTGALVAFDAVAPEVVARARGDGGPALLPPPRRRRGRGGACGVAERARRARHERGVDADDAGGAGAPAAAARARATLVAKLAETHLAVRLEASAAANPRS